MTNKRLHHVGIILPSLERAYHFMAIYGLEPDYSGYVAPYQAKYIFTKCGDGVCESPLELLIPEGGVLSEYNSGKGGIHHICYQVDDVDVVCAEFRGKGYGLLEETCPIVDGSMKINFVRPKYSEGILVEFMEILS